MEISLWLHSDLFTLACFLVMLINLHCPSQINNEQPKKDMVGWGNMRNFQSCTSTETLVMDNGSHEKKRKV